MFWCGRAGRETPGALDLGMVLLWIPPTPIGGNHDCLCYNLLAWWSCIAKDTVAGDSFGDGSYRLVLLGPVQMDSSSQHRSGIRMTFARDGSHCSR